MRETEITTVIFDWSGTLSDDRRLVWAANMKIMNHFGLDLIPFEDFIPQVKMTVLEMMEGFGLQADPRKINRLYLEKLAIVKRQGIVPEVYPDAVITLVTLAKRKVKLAVLSSHPKTHLLREAEDFGLSPLLNRLFGGSTDKAQDLRLVMAAFDDFDPNRILYVDDTVFGIRAAKKAGVRSAGICHGYHTRERLEAEQPDFLLADLRGILDITSG